MTQQILIKKMSKIRSYVLALPTKKRLNATRKINGHIHISDKCKSIARIRISVACLHTYE